MQPYWQSHGGSGPHLLLVHGFLCSESQWLPNIPALQEVCQPVTVELWGHHRSPSPPQPEAYRPDHYARCFDEIRAALGAEHWFVLGYSLGAGLAYRYVLEHPQRVLGSVLTNSTSALADAEQVRKFESSAEATAAALLAGGVPAMEKIAVHPRRARGLPSDVYEALVRDARQHDPLGIANTLRYTNPAASVRAQLAANPRPALLVCGARERRFQPLRDYAAAVMPRLEIVDLDAGHGMNMEAPEAFNRAVADFITRCLTSSTS